MNPELKTKWIEALRSGKYKQGKSRLKNADETMCCLGVLCDLMNGEWAKTKVNGNPAFTYYYGTEAIGDTLSLGIAREVGLECKDRVKVAQMNDNENKTFAEIADWIQENL